jgi:phage baseplate assembly protein W
MPAYIGYSSVNGNRPRSTNLPFGTGGGVGSMVNPVIIGNKFRSVDTAIVVQDFINALNIQKGQKVGQPGYGTTLWTFVFEPNTPDTQFQIENEIRRIANLDPRMILNTVNSYPQENGILLELEMAIAPFNNAFDLSVFFNNATNQAVIQ